MELEPAVDATLHIRYNRQTDRFMVDGSSEMPIYDIARLTLGDEDDFILFDNERPGAFRSASHIGRNQLAITALSKAIFDHNYSLFCESLREGAKLYDLPERSATVIVPYSNQRRLGRIGLHAAADNASSEVIALHQRIVAAQAQMSIDDGGAGDADQLPST